MSPLVGISPRDLISGNDCGRTSLEFDLGLMEGGARGNPNNGRMMTGTRPLCAEFSRSADWPRHSAETRLACDRAFRTVAPNYNGPQENREHA